MLIGTFTPKLDDKGRLILPAKFRDELAPGLVMTRGHEKCLFVFPMTEFVELHKSLRAAPLTSKQARDFNRVLLSGAHDEIPDKQGRVTVPAILREWAALGRDLAVVGTGNKLEIWDAAAWDAYLTGASAAFEDAAGEVVPDF
ncbi:cell division/cell wall cluster transcriptional repressor MraZ [Serinibacter arcticus]|uniref:Transcriptional regulator MraZ n=1 Tax=Serinibacter arcticus TaxID=1655435 RepID=A0A2U1ZSS4_9MICO|nr:division/cell wall cluster transcriptional repressor MraZ [Serinibacter arcticus]PWD50034.1 cell division/cell wall cluster transcriptional repressor MraZ [Serinibacter arcticus]